MSKYVFVTGGVVSSVGKGLVSASLASLLEARGLKVSIIKCDPYINVDPGTLSPFQHGEVYVTQDGAETDLDLGHYERFTHLVLGKDHSITTGQIYQRVIDKERKGEYLGRTVQIIPHITDEIKSRLSKAAKQADVTVVEIGGTIGDIEGLPFIEAIRQMRIELGPTKTAFVHVTLIPFIPTVGEFKSKPTQHSVKALREVGIQPDFLLCRSSEQLSKELKSKLALFSNLSSENVLLAQDAETIYEIPLLLSKEKFDEKLCKKLKISSKPPQIARWKKLVKKIKNPKKEVNIGLVGKYVNLRDSYQSLHEALIHAGVHWETQINIKYINSEDVKLLSKKSFYKDIDGILVPGGFGDRGVDGKLQAIQYARTSHLPFFGICLGMQMAAIEFARNVCGLKDAGSKEFKDSHKLKHLVVDIIPHQISIKKKGGSMRLGSYVCNLKNQSLIKKIYKKTKVSERHRHRYEFNSQYKDLFEKQGMEIVGTCQGHSELVEAIELKGHPWFLAVQYHPEFQSKPLTPHPLFVNFIQACLNEKFRQ